MKKISSLLIIGIFILSGIGSFGQSINHETDILSDYAIDLDIDIPQITYATKQIKNNAVSTVECVDEGSTIIVGEACLPVINRMVEIPLGGEPLIRVTNDQWISRSLSDLDLTYDIAPVQPSVIKNLDRDAFEFTINNEYYSTDLFYNTDKAKILETGMIRGHRYALIQIQPVQYNPVRGMVNILKDIDIELVVNDANIKETQKMISRYKMEEFDTILKERMLNFGEFEPLNDDQSFASNSYLIICDDSLSVALNSFVNWKTQIGFDVTVTTLSQIPGGPSKENIQDYIQDAYDTWNPAPGYVLLAGDTNLIPAFYGQSSNTATDLYYVTTAGTDYMPDILIGRFSGSQVSHITAMADKTVGYEQGYWSDDSFLNKGSFMAGTDNYHISEGTHNFVIDTYFEPKNWQCDKLYQVTYGATTQDVRDALSDGRVIAIFSGHGSTYSWADGPPFSQGDVTSLSNFKELSFVCSHACVTGNYEASECFGETWVREPNKAAIVFWGSSANTLWDEDDVLEKLTLSHYFSKGPVAQMTNNGLIGLHGHYGGGGYSRYYMECYNVLGDPSVVIGSMFSGGSSDPDVHFIPPRVGISRPSYGATVNGTVEIKGYAYGFEGPIKYVFIQIGSSDWMQADGTEEWSFTWDSNTVEDGEILLKAVSIDYESFQSGVDYARITVLNHPPEPEPKIPDLSCYGDLMWDQITPGEMVTANITLTNIGDNESLLNWEVIEFPEDWGRWTINPSNGVNLTPEDEAVIIRINLEAPEEYEQTYTGQIKIINDDDAEDYEIIDVNLVTIKDKSKDITLFHYLLNFLRQLFPHSILLNHFIV